MKTENKKGLICLTLGLGLAWLIVYLVKKEKKEDKTEAQPPVTDESVNIAVTAYKSALDAGEDAAALGEVNAGLKDEFGLYVEFRPLKGKFVVYNLAGKKVREL